MPTSIDHDLLAGWPLPSGGGSKYERGQVLVVGGAASAPGAVLLAGTAALRVGAGRLTLAVDEDVAPHVAVALPECAVTSLRSPGDEVERAGAVLIGPGLDDPDDAVAVCEALIPRIDPSAIVVLDAFALGVLPRIGSAEQLRGRLILTPNRQEAAMLLGEEDEDGEPDLAAIAERYGAVVSCFGRVAAPDGRAWSTSSEAEGLGTSGSGDVLAGAVVGLAARTGDAAQATVWGTWLHLRAAEHAGRPAGRLGYLAHELADALPAALDESVGR